VLGDVCWPADALTTPRSDGCAAGGADVGSGPMFAILLALGAVLRALFTRPAR
jgi:hypothetical protein